MHSALKAAVLFAVSAASMSCRPAGSLHILSDRKELASAVEMYSDEREDLQITMRHVDAMDARTIGIEAPDLVIGSFLNTGPVLDGLQPLALAADTYSSLAGPRDTALRPLLQPLSFELPLIVGKSESIAQLPDPVIVRPEDLREASAGHTRRNSEGRLIRLGFSPAWNPDTFADMLAIRFPNSLAGGIGPEADSPAAAVIAELRRWVGDAAGGAEPDLRFSRRYRYLPDDVLLAEGRVRFARTDFKTWASLPDSVSRQFDIRYFSGDRAIPVSAVTWAGIPKKAPGADPAADFVQWLLDADTQGRLMERWERDGVPVFGFLGGLSAVEEVNEVLIAERHPRMAGMIPEDHYLAVPPTVPHRWKRIREEMIGAWYGAAIREDESAGTFSEAFRRWDLSSLEDVS